MVLGYFFLGLPIIVLLGGIYENVYIFLFFLGFPIFLFCFQIRLAYIGRHLEQKAQKLTSALSPGIDFANRHQAM